MIPTTEEIEAKRLEPLKTLLSKIPSVIGSVGAGYEGKLWWAKFQIDIRHPLAWHTVQELGYVLNYLSLNERLPTVFKPVSPATYLNGGPEYFLSWVIECTSPEFSPGKCAEWVVGRLPQPIDNPDAWIVDDEQ